SFLFLDFPDVVFSDPMLHLIPNIHTSHVNRRILYSEKAALPTRFILASVEAMYDSSSFCRIEIGIIHAVKTERNNHRPEPLTSPIPKVLIFHDVVFHANRKRHHHLEHRAKAILSTKVSINDFVWNMILVGISVTQINS